MVHELELIQFLEKVAHLVETGNDAMAVSAIDKMIYDLCMQVEQFEMEMAPA
jgi:uncharacterized protein YihD (DUF1040 family)